MAWIATVFLLASSCGKDEYFGPIYPDNGDTTAITPSANRLLVGCEGNFQLGNAGLSLIYLDSDKVSNGVFELVNGRPLGDVLQAIEIIGNALFLTINNSGTVLKLDKETLEMKGEATGLVSPRFMQMHHGKMLVSDLYSKAIAVVDTATMVVESEVATGAWTERFAVFNGQSVVIAVDTKELLGIGSGFSVEKRVPLGFVPVALTSYRGNLIVFGNTESTPQKTVVAVFDDGFSRADSVQLSGVLVSAEAMGDTLVLLTKSDMVLMSALTLDVLKGFTHGVQNAYGLCVDSSSHTAFVADARDYLSAGEVVRFDVVSGAVLSRFGVGIIPQAMKIYALP